MKDYFQKFADCVDEKGKPIPLTEKLSVAEIEKRLESVERKITIEHFGHIQEKRPGDAYGAVNKHVG